MNQTDREFLKNMMQERIAQHYAARERVASDTQRFNTLEERLNDALSHLTEEQARDVHHYLEYTFEQSGQNELFFYRCGLQDGYKLCLLINKWVSQV